MMLPIYVNPDNIVNNPQSLLTITRPDGKQIEFRKTNGVWQNESSITEHLTEIDDSNGNATGYTYTTVDDTVEHYDAAGKLLSIADVRGNTQTLGYDTASRLATVTTNTGESLTFGYDASNRISTMTDQTGRVWLFGYDTNNNLTSVTYPDATPTDNTDNPERVYLYENASFPHALTSITDCTHVSSCSTAAVNHYANFEYDSTGRTTASYHGPQTPTLTDRIEGVSIVYNSDGTRTVTNSRNKVSTYSTTTQLGLALVTGISGPGCSSCGTSNTTSTYDASNNLASKNENGHITRYGNYDANGNPGCKVEGVSSTDTSIGVCAFDSTASPKARRLDYTYDSRFHSRVATISEPSVSAGQHKLTTNQYDVYGNLTNVAITGFKPDGTAVARTTTGTYAGPLHQISQIDGPRTDVQDLTALAYYPDDPTQGSNRARLLRVTGPTGIVLRDAIQYSATGKVLSESRPNGVALTYSYYAGNDRLQTLTQTAGGVSRTLRWTYLPTGEVATITTADGTAAATTLTFGYDAGRRLTRVTDGLGNYIQYTLDTEDNRTGESTYDSSGALKKAITRTFDDYNHLYTRSQANEITTTSVAPDGTLSSALDGKSSTTGYGYDALKRLTSSTQDQGGSDPTTQNALSQYQYNAHDDLMQVTDPDGNATSYSYDDLGNLLSQTSPDTGPTQYSYDAAGNLKTRTDALSQQFNYNYDAANRLTLIDAPGSNDDITYGYDTCANGLGRLCKVSTPGNSVFYTYTAFGEIASSEGIRYGYDTAGRVQSITYPSGAVVSYSYDAAGQVNSVQLTRNGTVTNLATGIAHIPFGPVTALTYGNGLTLAQSLDSAYRLQSQAVPNALNLTYPQYDANGNLTQRSDSFAAPALSTFSYDALNRFGTASGPFGSRTYVYDKNGNRVQLNDGTLTAYDYEPLGAGTQNNRLAQIGSANVLNDANGNMLSNGVWTYTYNTHNRMTQAKQNGTVVGSYVYNGLGQRISKTLATNKGRVFLYGTHGELLAEADQGGTVLSEYIYLDGTLLAINQPDDNGNGTTNVQEDVAGTNPVSADYDGDGLSNLTEWFVTGTNANLADTDGDGVSDGVEVTKGTDPLNGATHPGDGDLNQDGRVDAGDLVLEMQIVLGTRIPTAVQLVHGDMNQDGVITLPDMLKLERKVLGLALNNAITTLPGYQTLIATLDQAGATIHSKAHQFLASLIDEAQATTPSGKIYYVHTDQLGTPQVLTDETGAIAWRASYDPFGKATVTVSTIEMNIRMSGSYWSSETELMYVWNRDLDPKTGEWTTSDPIGLAGGLNTYLYADANPINKTDLLGLATYQCTRRLNYVPFRAGPLYHQFVCTGNAKGGYSCGGLGPTTDNPFDSPSQVERDQYKPSACNKVQDDNQCTESCITKKFSSSLPNYSVDLSHGDNCQTYANQIVSECVAKCNARHK
jgi:RHS repeat-associated protein